MRRRSDVPPTAKFGMIACEIDAAVYTLPFTVVNGAELSVLQ
jgi:hypothetical protein